MIIKSKFKPKRLLTNPHLQSMLPTFVMRKKPRLATRSERVELSDGDFIDLEWYGPSEGPIVLMIHGITGNIDSPYIKYSMPEFAKYGWRSVMKYYRGYSGVDNRTEVISHAGYTGDIRELIEILHQREPDTPIVAIGYSQGGNMLLKYLGEVGSDTPLKCAVAVSPPFQLRNIANRIRYGMSRFYQWYLLRQLRQFFKDKFQYRSTPFDTNSLDRYNSFWSFDENVTAPLNGFKGAVDYYRQASCINYLIDIKIPTLIIHSIDDSIMTPDVIPTEAQLSATVTLELSEHGGHLGFVDGSLRKPQFWLNRRIPEYLRDFLPSSSS